MRDSRPAENSTGPSNQGLRRPTGGFCRAAGLPYDEFGICSTGLLRRGWGDGGQRCGRWWRLGQSQPPRLAVRHQPRGHLAAQLASHPSRCQRSTAAMTTGMSCGQNWPASIPACVSAAKASTEPNHTTNGDAVARRRSRRRTRPARLRADTWSAPFRRSGSRLLDAYGAGEIRGSEGALHRSRLEVTAGQPLVDLLHPLVVERDALAQRGICKASWHSRLSRLVGVRHRFVSSITSLADITKTYM